MALLSAVSVRSPGQLYRDVVVPEHHGIVAGFATGQTSKFQSLMDAGALIRLKRGSQYLIEESLLPSVAGTGIVSDGSAEIKLSAAFDNPTNVIGTRWNSDAVGILATGVDDLIFEGFKLTKVILDGVHVKGLALRNCDRFFVHRLDMAGYAAGGGIITLDSCEDGHVEKCKIHDSTTNVAELSQLTGIEVDNDLIAGAVSRNLVLAKNIIRSLTAGATKIAFDGYETDGINVANKDSIGHQIIGNIIEIVGEGIDHFGMESLIAYNIIRDAYLFGIKLVHGASYNVIEVNAIHRPGISGLELDGSATAGRSTSYNRLANNLIRNVDAAGDWSASTTSGVRTNDNGGTTFLATDNDIIGNKIVDDQAVATMKHAIFDGGTGTGNVFENNQGRGYTVSYHVGPGTSRVRRPQPVAYRAFLSGAQSIAGAASAKVTFDSESFDDTGDYDNATNHRFIADYATKLNVRAQIEFIGVTAGKIMGIQLRVNNAIVSRKTVEAGAAGGSLKVDVQDVVTMAKGNYLEVFAENGDTVARSVSAVTSLSYVAVSELK